MSIYLEQKNYRNNQFSIYCSSFDRHSSVSASKSTKWKLNQKIKLWQSRYRQRKALAKLDQRLLKDIGYTHQQARLEIEKPFWK